MKRPTSKIEFFEHVPIPTDFKHEPLFGNRNEQRNYFNQFKNKKLTFEGSYQRVEEQIKTKFKYEDLVDVNYVHIKNPSYPGAPENQCEWWGFVMDIHYINDGLVTVDWVVDPIQTFMFDWELNQAFIERGMVNSVLENENNKRYIDDKKVSILTNGEPIGVDGLAYYLTHDNLMEEGDEKERRLAFLVLLIGDSENQTFVGVPSQIDYYVLPFDKRSGTVYDFEIKNVQSSTGKTTVKSTNNGMRFTIHEAIAEIANDMELTKGGKAILTSYIQNEIGFDFKVEGKKVVATMSDFEWKYEGAKGHSNVEVYNVGKKQSDSNLKPKPKPDDSSETHNSLTNAQEKNASKIWKLLRNKGYTKQAIAGILGNMEQESGIVPDKEQIGGPAYGLVQWDGSSYPLAGEATIDGRQYVKNILSTAGISGDYRSIETQIELLEWCMHNGQYIPTATYPYSVEQFKGLTDIETATMAFLKNYERPQDNHPERIDFAKKWYEKLKNI